MGALKMPYELTFAEEENILVFEVTGNRAQDNAGDDAVNAWGKVASICSEKGYSRILAISRLSGRDKRATFNDYYVGTSLDSLGIKKNWKIAFIDLGSEKNPDLNFAETVAVNRGFSIKLFTNENDARNWLAD
jgi:hypothetical protein